MIIGHLPPPAHPGPDPSITLGEFYAGDYPATVNPALVVPLDLVLLADEVEFYIRKKGHVPA